jgi:hypothetical protein
MPKLPTNAATTSPNPCGRSRTLLLVVVAGGLLLVLGVAAGWVTLQQRQARMVGLEGTWRDGANSRHTHQFRANGSVDSWYGSLPMESFMTWRRHGNTITVKTERNWDFVGVLEGNEIRGKMLLLDERGRIEQEIDMVWRRE